MKTSRSENFLIENEWHRERERARFREKEEAHRYSENVGALERIMRNLDVFACVFNLQSTEYRLQRDEENEKVKERPSDTRMNEHYLMFNAIAFLFAFHCKLYILEKRNNLLFNNFFASL